MSCEKVTSVKLVDYQVVILRSFSQSYFNNRTSCIGLIINKLRANFGECMLFALFFLPKIGIWQFFLFTFAPTDLCVCENLGKNGLESAVFEQKYGRFYPVVSRFAVLAGIF